MDKEIVDYVLQAQKHGLADFEIKQNLLNAGWEAGMVEQSFILSKAADTHSGGGGSSPQIAGYPNSQGTNFRQQRSAFQNTHTTIAISEQSFDSRPASKPFLKNKILWLVVVILLVLGGSAFGYYKFVYLTPASIFNKFLTVKSPAVYQSDYSLTYSYTEASSTEPTALTLSGSAYYNGQNVSSSESGNAFTLGMKSASGSASVNLQYLLLNNIFYFNISKVSMLKSLGSDWVKLDLGQLQKYLSSHSTTSDQSLNNLMSNQDLKTKLHNLITGAKIINPTNFLAKESVKGVPVYHLKLTLDSQALAKTVSQAVDLIQSDPSFKSEKISDSQRSNVNSLLGKLTLKEGDIWIGQKDSELYQIHLSFNVPSVQDLSDPNFYSSISALDGSLAKQRDATRLTDARQLNQALQLYYNDHGGYPEGKMGIPQGLIPTYIASWPVAPTPLDGTCTDYFNGYWYKNKGTEFTKNDLKLYSSFTLTFCLGEATGGYGAGIGMVTPSGIAGSVACPATPDLCVNSKPAAAENIQAKIDSLKFNSSLVMDETLYNFGKTQTLTVPENPVDLMQMLEGLFGSFFPTNSTFTPKTSVQ